MRSRSMTSCDPLTLLQSAQRNSVLMKQQQWQQQWQQQQQPADFQAMSRKIMKSIEAGRSRGHVNAPQEQQQRHGSGGAHGDSSERDLVVGGADGGFSGHGAGGGNGCCGGIPSLTLRAALANMTPSCKPRRDCGEDNGSGCGDWGNQLGGDCNFDGGGGRYEGPLGGNGCFGRGTSGPGAGGTALQSADSCCCQ